mmetsp:Transcript_11960/g.18259  ORF Transcript_11960/g.18259 Transcript_11960/m.18259 type:complete len:244 (-) Transcript_11960:320-1051(-)
MATASRRCNSVARGPTSLFQWSVLRTAGRPEDPNRSSALHAILQDPPVASTDGPSASPSAASISCRTLHAGRCVDCHDAMGTQCTSASGSEGNTSPPSRPGERSTEDPSSDGAGRDRSRRGSGAASDRTTRWMVRGRAVASRDDDVRGWSHGGPPVRLQMFPSAKLMPPSEKSPDATHSPRSFPGPPFDEKSISIDPPPRAATAGRENPEAVPSAPSLPSHVPTRLPMSKRIRRYPSRWCRSE